MNLWIDDIRIPNPIYELWAKTSGEALSMLEKYEDDIERVSFDHDLGGDDTSRRVINWIEERAFNGIKPPSEMTVHSANPVGRKYLESGIKNAYRMFDINGRKIT